MDKIEALTRITMTIESVRGIRAFEGKAELIKKLNGLYDLVNLYKESWNCYELCVKEAETLIGYGKEINKNGK